MTRALTFILFCLLSSCHGSANTTRERPPQINAENLRPTIVNTSDYLLLEMTAPKVLKRKDRIIFRFSVVAPWDMFIDEDSIRVELEHNEKIIVQKKIFTKKSANKIDQNRTYVFDTLLVARKKGKAKITVKASCLACDKDDECMVQGAVRSLNFLIK